MATDRLHRTLALCRVPWSNSNTSVSANVPQDQEAIVTVLAVSAVMAVSVMKATPLNLTPLIRHIDKNIFLVPQEHGPQMHISQ